MSQQISSKMATKWEIHGMQPCSQVVFKCAQDAGDGDPGHAVRGGDEEGNLQRDALPHAQARHPLPALRLQRRRRRGRHPLLRPLRCCPALPPATLLSSTCMHALAHHCERMLPMAMPDLLAPQVKCLQSMASAIRAPAYREWQQHRSCAAAMHGPWWPWSNHADQIIALWLMIPPFESRCAPM